MGFLSEVLDRTATIAAKSYAAAKAFEAGKNGGPPPQYSESEAGRILQQVSDEAYAQGQRSVLVKIGTKLSE